VFGGLLLLLLSALLRGWTAARWYGVGVGVDVVSSYNSSYK